VGRGKVRIWQCPIEILFCNAFRVVEGGYCHLPPATGEG
jgi:hypothetical protein